MPMNTMYKHLARHIKETDVGAYEAFKAVRELTLNFAAEMEKRQPTSFDRAEFLKQAEVEDDGRQHES